MKLKLGVFDDHDIVIQGVKAGFEKDADIDVVWAGNKLSDINDAIDTLQQLDVLLCDVVGTDFDGYDVFRWLKTNVPSLKVIAYTSLNSTLLIDYLLEYSIKGYVSKQEKMPQIIEAVKDVASGKLYFPEDCKNLLSNFRPEKPQEITSRELEILQLIASEWKSSEIAKKCNISISTVENHRKNIFRKLEVSNVAGMVSVARDIGYLK